MTQLIDQYDALIVDADGVIYRGSQAVAHATESLTAAGTHVPWCVVTNNAASPPSAVAERISGLGLALSANNVITSPQGAMAYLHERGVAVGSPILVVGGPGIDEAVLGAGFRPVRDRGQSPAAVVQGLGMEIQWRDLAEAAYAISEGALWVATNLDVSLPTERGLAPGNGALVGAIELAIGRSPDASTGKPEPLLFRMAAERLGAAKPLVLGDRLDTDICGGNRAGMDSLLVLTGVTGVTEISEMISAEPEFRPTYIAEDLRALGEPAQSSRVDPSAPGMDALAEIRRLLGRVWEEPASEASLRPAWERAIAVWAAQRSGTS